MHRLWGLTAIALLANNTLVAQAPSTNASLPRRIDVVDAGTRWQFATIENAVVDSSVIRLADVVRPLHSNLAAWPRLQGATIGLIPLNGTQAKLSRDRIAGWIQRAEATPTMITIHGAETITVHRVPSGSRLDPSAGERALTNPSVRRVGYESTRQVDDTATLEVRGTVESDVPKEVADRVRRWFELGMQQDYRELYESFDLEIIVRSDGIGSLDSIQGIREIQWIDPPPTWSPNGSSSPPTLTKAAVIGRSSSKSCQGEVQVVWRARPAMVAARQSMRRGQRVAPGDVEFQPLPKKVPPSPDAVASPNDILGMEVVGQVRGGVALSMSDFAPPRLIRRGDLVEILVSGGGIRVTSTAKSLGEGAAGDLVEIETLQPRRRLMARVVNSSRVEIITSPHRVHRSEGASP